MENLRVSSYIILVKLDNENGKYMLLHGYTGAIDLIDADLAAYLRDNKHDTSTSSLLPSEIKKRLYKRGYLTNKTEEEEYLYVNKMAAILHKKETLTQISYTTVVTYDCNFRCPYCFEHTLHAENRPLSDKTLTAEMIDNIYNNIAKIEAKYQRSRERIKFMELYGGEPLLAKNRDIVQYIVKRGCEMNFKFRAITNGYDLEYYKDLLNPEQISSLQITIDGKKECHDSRRIHYSQGATFDKILKNIEMALQQGVHILVRINTDRIISDQLEELFTIFQQLHFFDYKGFSMESALLRNHNTNGVENIQFMSMKEYLLKHKDAKYKYGCQYQHLYKNILNTIQGKGRMNLHSTYCNSQCNGYVFDPLGKLYPCWDFVGDPQHIIGDYNNTSLTINSLGESWRNHDIRYGDKCKNCKYAFLCGGGCLARATLIKGKFKNSDCNNFPIIIKEAANRAFNEYKANII